MSQKMLRSDSQQHNMKKCSLLINLNEATVRMWEGLVATDSPAGVFCKKAEPGSTLATSKCDMEVLRRPIK